MGISKNIPENQEFLNIDRQNQKEMTMIPEGQPQLARPQPRPGMFTVTAKDKLLTVAVRRTRAYWLPGLTGYQPLDHSHD